MGGSFTLHARARPSHPIVGLQLVNLLAVHLEPKVLANELDDLERVGEARPVLCVALDESLAHLEADRLELPAGMLQLCRRRIGAEQLLHELNVQKREA